MDKYRFNESDEEEFFGNRKRYFYLDEIVRFYDVPHEEVEKFITEGEETYKRRRYSEMRKSRKY